MRLPPMTLLRPAFTCGRVFLSSSQRGGQSVRRAGPVLWVHGSPCEQYVEREGARGELEWQSDKRSPRALLDWLSPAADEQTARKRFPLYRPKEDIARHFLGRSGRGIRTLRTSLFATSGAATGRREG